VGSDVGGGDNGVLHLDMGISSTTGTPVMDVIAERFPRTLVLAGTSLVLWMVLAFITGVTAGMQAHAVQQPLVGGATEFLFEPSADRVLGALLPHFLNFKIYQVLLEAKASEQSSRMVAMKNATDNANQLIKDLTLEYNKLRQANITKELLEIASAAMALG